LSKTIAIIPARGGSKRLPKKNLLELGGEPLIIHSINYAKNNLGIIDTIVVSTDDPEIKKIALQQGVEVVDRPDELSGDEAPTITALQHVLQNIDEDVSEVVLLQATNPLRPEDLLKDAWKAYQQGFESLMSVTSNRQKFGRIKDGKFTPYNYSFGQRSQDMDPLYFENGLLYIAKADLVRKGTLLGELNLPFVIEHPYAYVDIDDAEDLAYAEFVMNRYNQ